MLSYLLVLAPAGVDAVTLGDSSTADPKFEAQDDQMDGPTPLVSPGGWLTYNDYPTAALRENRTGRTSFRLTVSSDGLPTACTITQSSGSADLDDATCKAVMSRARFRPALDSRSQPIEGHYSSHVRWLIPKDPILPRAYDRTITFVVQLDGSVTDCHEVGSPDASDDNDPTPSSGCPSGFSQSYVDESGRPVRRKVTFHVNTTVAPVP